MAALTIIESNLSVVHLLLQSLNPFLQVHALAAVRKSVACL